MSKYAKVIPLSDNVEVIIKKSVTEGKHSLEFTFISEADEEILTTSITSLYNFKDKRDKDYNKLTKDNLQQLGMTLPIFKDLI